MGTLSSIRRKAGGIRRTFGLAILAVFIVLAIPEFTPIPGFLAAVIGFGIVGWWIYDSWPPWPTGSQQQLNDLRGTDSTHADPADAAEALDVLRTDADDFSTEELQFLAEAMAFGTQSEEDPERVIAEFRRQTEVDDQDIPELIFDRLFDLYDGSESPLPIAKINEIKAKSKHSIIKYGFTGALQWSDIEFDEERQVPENRIQIGSMLAIERFAVIMPVPVEYYQKLVDALGSEIERVRGAAAVTLGSIGYYHPDRAAEVTEQLAPLLEDDSDVVRHSAVRALEGPAMTDDKAYELLIEVSEGLDPDMREIGQIVLEEVEEYRNRAQSRPESGREEEQDQDESEPTDDGFVDEGEMTSTSDTKIWDEENPMRSGDTEIYVPGEEDEMNA